jgi:hypothetical protein
MLKQFKVITLAPTCFGSRRTHHQGAVLRLAKTTDMVFFVLVDMDSVNAMAAYRPVVQVCVSRWRKEEMHITDARNVQREVYET